MKKVTLILGLFLLANTGLTAEPMSNLSLSDSENICRVSCTVSVPDGFGGMIGITATAGNMFTSCETAGERACAKAGEKSIAILMDAN